MMKEYLDVDNGYALVVADDEIKRGGNWIEIPEGAEFAICFGAEYQHVSFYKNVNDELKVCSPNFPKWSETEYEKLEDIDYKSVSGYVVWQHEQSFDEIDTFVESNVELSSVEQTLAERQGQYGSFVGVANTTGQLMGVLLNSKNGHTLPYAHQEALHMICSKMARIVNGNYNHLDSWHDIGGYAKLIENLIEGK